MTLFYNIVSLFIYTQSGWKLGLFRIQYNSFIHPTLSGKFALLQQ